MPAKEGSGNKNQLRSAKETSIATLACFSSIGITALLVQWLLKDSMPLLVASMGASAVILFILPGSPLAQPWSFVAGQFVSAFAGVMVGQFIFDPAIAASSAVGLSVLLMLLLRCLHPPGAATALAPILAATPDHPPDLHFILAPLGINVLLMLGLVILINRYLLQREYPVKSQAKMALQPNLSGNSEISNYYAQEIQQVVAGFGNFLDVSFGDLQRFYLQVQQLAFERQQETITCADIMLRNVVTVEYDTDVEFAWSLMQQQHLKVLPVLDRSGRVIGIITLYDFLKHVQLSPYANFQQQFLTFIRKTHADKTSKPESVGHIMTRKVTTLSSETHIAGLVGLMSAEGHRYVPIVDGQQRFVGLVFQRDLLAALFHSKAKEAIGH